MKKSLFILFTLVLSLSSCTKNEDSDISKFTKNIDLSISPCEYITKQMIVCHFGISSAELMIQGGDNQISQNDDGCGYFWKKSGHDENSLQPYQAKLKTSENHVKIGNFRTYEDNVAAIRDFKKTYWVSSNEVLKREFNKVNAKEYEELEANSNQLSNDFQESHKNGLRLTEVYGIGDEAFYNHINKSLDVRFGTLSFSVFIETEMDTEVNILIAKKLAYEVWRKL